MNQWDYIEAGFRVFGLHGVTDGVCDCGNPECEALYKHPRVSSWQHTPDWSDEQLENMEYAGHFDTGFGVLCSGWLIIDVDARNGGVKSFKKLAKDYPTVAECAFVVNTGSGGGSQHLYFKAPEGVAMVQSHKDYPGIDFKTSGYVVGAGSLHASGNSYEVERGHPCDVTDAPAELVELLKKPEYRRVEWSGGTVDVNEQHIKNVLSYIGNNDADYELYIRVGMAIHHCLGESGFELWDDWCASSNKNNSSTNERKWHSFGKTANPVGYGTLIQYARENGYCEPVTFEYQVSSDDQKDNELDTSDIDLKRPPGFVGELAQWINGQCLYPRENLAVAAALVAVSSLSGMRHYDEMDDMTANIIAFCIAGSSTGKEAVQQAYLKIMRTAGIQGAVHGGFKSEQELMRNLIRHQAAFYSIDEFGLVLRKLVNASKRGGASYLEGLIAMVMSVYSKANGYLPITGDLKEEIREHLSRESARTEKQLDETSDESKRAKLETLSLQLREALRKIDDGLDSPYLNIIGYTTPVTFNSLMDFEMATNGFMSRAMIFDDLETNPERKRGFKKTPMTDGMAAAIRNLYAPGCYDMLDQGARVEYIGEKTSIPTTNEGREMLDKVYDYFHQVADQHKSATGMEAIPRRGYEIAAKASLILALPSGVRTAEHVRWSFALAKRDIDRKIKLAYAEDRADHVDGLAAKVLSIVDGDHGETLGVICNRLRSTPKESVKSLLDDMLKKGMIREERSIHPKRKTETVRYFSC